MTVHIYGLARLGAVSDVFMVINISGRRRTVGHLPLGSYYYPLSILKTSSRFLYLMWMDDLWRWHPLVGKDN